MARDSMSWLIALLRTKVNDTDEDIWTDDQLQTYLDMHRVHVRREQLTKDVDEAIYHSAHGMLEGDTDTWDNDAEIIKMWDSPSASATAYTPDAYNLTDGVFTFDADQGANLYLDAIAYNLHGAIAECMEQLAMDPAKAKQWERGGVRYTHYDLLEIAKYHRNFDGLQSTIVTRVY